MQWGTEEAVLGWELDFPICSLHHWGPVKDQMPMFACAAQSAAPSLHAILLSHRHNLTALGSFCARIFILFSFFYLLFSFLNSRAILSSALHQQRGRQPGNLNLEASVCCFWLWAGSGFGAEMLSELKWLSDRIRETNPSELSASISARCCMTAEIKTHLPARIWFFSSHFAKALRAW